MTYGIQTFDSGWNLLFDSSLVAVGCPVGVYLASSSSSSLVSFPQHAGRSASIIQITGYLEYSGASVEYSQGYPRVTIPQRNPDETVYWIVVIS